MRTVAVVTAVLVASALGDGPAHAQVTQQAVQRARAAIVPFTSALNIAELNTLNQRLADAAVAAARQVPGAQLLPVSAARDVRVGLVVQGTAARDRNDLVFSAIVVNASDGKIVHRFPSERAPADAPDAAINRVASRIAGMLAMYADPEVTNPSIYSVATIEAYTLERRGVVAFSDNRTAEALAALTEAAQRDTTYIRALLLGIAIHGNEGRPAVRDSLFNYVFARQDRLSDIDRLALSWFRDPPPQSFAAARAALAMDPGSSVWAYGVGIAANRAGYFRDAVAVLGRRAEFVARGDYQPRVWGPWRSQFMDALHATGDFTRELAEVKLARAEMPRANENLFFTQELRALAGLGRISELRAVVARQLARRADSVPITPLQTGGLELIRHGHRQDGQKIIDEVTAFARAHEREVDSLSFATALATSKDYANAIPRLERLAANSNLYVRIGRYGVFSIFAGRPEIGDQVMARLAAMGDNLNSHLWRGLLTAARGDCNGAVSHFRAGIDRGLVYGASSFHHWDPSTEPIWNCDAFKNLVPMKAP